MSRIRRGVFAIFFVLVLPLASHAWSSAGHRIAAIMAWRTMSAETRSQIAELLRQHPRIGQEFRIPSSVSQLGTAAENEWLFAQATIWPDLIRGIDQYDRPTWHYIDLPLYLTAGDEALMKDHMTVNLSSELPEDWQHQELNAAQAVQVATKILGSDKPAAEKAIFVCWMNHLVTDLAQPCHTTALYSRLTFPDPNCDKGGNSIRVQPAGNLHAYWDGLLGRDDVSFEQARKRAAELLEKFAQYKATDQAELDAMKWVKQGNVLAKAHVYSPEILQAAYDQEVGNTHQIASVNLNEPYQAKSIQLAERQIARGAFRLAGILQASLVDASTESPQKETVPRPNVRCGDRPEEG